MKLLIDIEQEYYELIKYNVEHGVDYKPLEIIANGIPYKERPLCSNCGANMNTCIGCIHNLGYRPNTDDIYCEYIEDYINNNRCEYYEKDNNNG